MIKPLHYLRFTSNVLLFGLNTVETNAVLNIAIIKGDEAFCCEKNGST